MEESRGHHDPTLLLPENPVIASLPLSVLPSFSRRLRMGPELFRDPSSYLWNSLWLVQQGCLLSAVCQSEVQWEVVFRLGDESSPPDLRVCVKQLWILSWTGQRTDHRRGRKNISPLGEVQSFKQWVL